MQDQQRLLPGRALSRAWLGRNASFTAAELGGAIFDTTLADFFVQWPEGFEPEDTEGLHVLSPDLDLSGFDLRGMRLEYADFSEVDLSGADLSGTDLRGARVTGIDFAEVNWSQTHCPDGTLSDFNGQSCTENLELK